MTEEQQLEREIISGIAVLLARLTILPPSRERSLAKTKMQEARMWLCEDYDNQFGNDKEDT